MSSDYSPPSVDAIRNCLKTVTDPELGDNILDLGMVRSIKVDALGNITVEIALTIASCPMRNTIKQNVLDRIEALPDVESVDIKISEMDKDQRSSLMQRARQKAQQNPPTTSIGSSTKVLAIASGKGGVGKSSLTANLAIALASQGLSIGVLDADIWGFSIPRILGIDGVLGAEKKEAGIQIEPLNKQVGKGNLKVVSMGFLSAEEEAIMWRGLILKRALQHFIEDVNWGFLDYLLIDMPPGTGDIQMGLANMLPKTEMIIVTIPAKGAQKVASRTADMSRKANLSILGVVENMSYFQCEDGNKYSIFGKGGGEQLSRDIQAPFLGSIPLDPSMAEKSDQGKSVVDTDSPLSEPLKQLGRKILQQCPPASSMKSCTAYDLFDSILRSSTRS